MNINIEQGILNDEVKYNFNIPCSTFLVQCPLFNIPCSTFLVQYSLFNIPCSIFLVQYSLFNIPYCANDILIFTPALVLVIGAAVEIYGIDFR